MVCQGLGKGENEESLSNEQRVSFLQDDKTLEIGCTLLNQTLKNGEDSKFYLTCLLPQLKIKTKMRDRDNQVFGINNILKVLSTHQIWQSHSSKSPHQDCE